MRTSIKRFEIRKYRIRKKIKSVSDRCRLTIVKSNRHISAQIVDSTGRIIAAASTIEKGLLLNKKNMCNKIFASKVADLISARAIEAGIKDVVFDRSGHEYHGVVKVFADTARQRLNF